MLIAIITISSLILAGLIAGVLYFLFNKELLANDSGKVMFEIDYKNRRIRNMNHPSLSGTKIPNSQKINHFYSGKWIELDKFLTFFDASSIKRYRNGLHAIHSDKEIKISFYVNPQKNHSSKGAKFSNKVKNKKKRKDFLMQSTIFNCDNGLIGGEIKFALPTIESSNVFPDLITGHELFKYNDKYISLWVFNMRLLDAKSKNTFFVEMKRALNIKSINYFLYENKLVLVMPTSSIVQMQKRIKKKQLNIKKVMDKKGFLQFFDQSGIIHTKKINSPKQNKEALIKLDYLIWKSLKLNAPATYVEDDIQNFQKYKHAYITVEQSIKASSMTTLTTKVRSYTSKRALINYLYPDIKEVPPRLIAMVLSNPNMREKLMNSHANKVMNDEKTQPAILDVNSEWLVQNVNKIKNPKIIYMIEYQEQTPQKIFFATIMQLQENGILCGIRISKIDIKHMTALSRVAPKFIVIDRGISKRAHVIETYVKLSAIKEVTQQTKSRIIYELPSSKIDAKQKAVIGLNFYYDYK